MTHTAGQQGGDEKKTWDAPPRIQPRIKHAPRVRDVYWCDFPEDAHLPEMWKTRPVIMFGRKSSLKGTAAVIPLTTHPQGSNKAAVEITSPINKEPAWTRAITSRAWLPESSVDPQEWDYQSVL